MAHKQLISGVAYDTKAGRCLVNGVGYDIKKGRTLIDGVGYDISFGPPHIYGAEWDGTSTPAWTRTDGAVGFSDPVPAVGGGTGSSPFDAILPWSGMVRVTDAAAGELVKIPKYWYKWTRNGTAMKLQISNIAEAGFLTSPAHADRGDGKGERDYVYVGRYHCGSTYKSVTGASPKVSITRATARSGIHALGSTIWQYDYAMYWTIMMLYLVEYASWDSQSKIGYGCGNNSNVQAVGASDSMQYHTGTMQASRVAYGVGVQYRYIEGLWDNAQDWCDGICFSGTSVYCLKNPTNFSDNSSGTNVGTRTTTSDYISAWTSPSATGFEYALYPSGTVGSSTTYVCDYCSYDSDGVILYVGGNYSQYLGRGAFCLGGSGGANNKGSFISCRLQKLP